MTRPFNWSFRGCCTGARGLAGRGRVPAAGGPGADGRRKAGQGQGGPDATSASAAQETDPAAWVYTDGKWVRTKKAEPILTKKDQWVNVFDGKTLKDWKATAFEDCGKVTAGDGELRITMGKGDLTGVTWTGGALPKTNYEIALEARRIEGEDFFCGLTFPVKDNCISLIVGGWGGPVVGLSSLDGYDAYNNETTRLMTFERDRWYKIRVRITDTLIAAWIDDEQMVECKLTRGEDDKPVWRRVSVRSEVDLSQPFGLAAFRTTAGLRDIRVRLLTDAEVAAQEKAAADKIGV